MLTVHTFTFNPFQENTYVLTDSETKEALIIDPGCFTVAERRTLDTFLADYKPVAILNTHGHLDHVFGVNHLVAKYKIPFYLHPLEGPILRNVPAVAERYGMGLVPSIDQYSPLATGPFAFAGHELQIWHTPGHAPGHVVIYAHNLNTVIGGDVLFRESIGRTDFPYCSFDDLQHSIRQVFYALPDDTIVLSGHGPETTIGHEKRHNPYVPA
jgi:glyoxylase-like metal-dependent hydrolase (beta-lactamase superfamily II)